MKFKEVKTYQSVRFFKGQETFFSRGVKGLEDLVMEEVSWGIRVKTANDEVIVSFANIAYAKPEDTLAEQQEKKKASAAKSL
jgi:hypothetical protein